MNLSFYLAFYLFCWHYTRMSNVCFLRWPISKNAALTVDTLEVWVEQKIIESYWWKYYTMISKWVFFLVLRFMYIFGSGTRQFFVETSKFFYLHSRFRWELECNKWQNGSSYKNEDCSVMLNARKTSNIPN